MITINPSIETIKLKIHEYKDKTAVNILQNLTLKVFYKAKKLASKHNRTGLMERNLTYRLNLRNLTGFVYEKDIGMLVYWRKKGKRINYANFVHFGTRPHIIEPYRRKALRFVVKDKLVFAKRVHHTGYKGDPFLYKALNSVAKKLKKEI